MFNPLKKAVGLTTIAALAMGAATSAGAADKHKVFLSMSYIGNDWQAESSNMIKAMAASKTLKDKIDFDVQVAGPNAQKQIQQINAMVQAGAKAIIVFPISPTALNGVVKAACAKGVKVFAYESVITEPCAYNVSIDNKENGRLITQFVVDALGGKGNIVYINGVPGVSAEEERTQAVKEVLAKNPGIKVVAQAAGMWSESVARAEMTKILASHKWDEIDGVVAQLGCFSINELQIEAGIPESKLKPCAGEAGNGNLVQMLPIGTDVPGAKGSYRPMGANDFSTFAPASTGAYALKLAIDVLEGKDVPHNIVIKPNDVTKKNVKMCKTGSWDEMKAGCNVFPISLVSNPGWYPAIFNENTPEVGLTAAMTGKPD
jgi:ribose transport system substrate-binding protein